VWKEGDIRIFALFPAPRVVILQAMNQTLPLRLEPKPSGTSCQSTRFADMAALRLPGARLAFTLRERRSARTEPTDSH
jgi:hypothetical protein